MLFRCWSHCVPTVKFLPNFGMASYINENIINNEHYQSYSLMLEQRSINYTRKRLAILVRHLVDGRIVTLLCLRSLGSAIKPKFLQRRFLRRVESKPQRLRIHLLHEHTVILTSTVCHAFIRSDFIDEVIELEDIASVPLQKTTFDFWVSSFVN